MKVLLDTHLFLWWVNDEQRLSGRAKAYIACATKVFVSSASIWEASIKVNLGKLNVDVQQLVEEIDINGFGALPVLNHHALAVASLPIIHHDPFDRILIAQSTSETMMLLTGDRIMRAYSPLVVLV